MISKRAKRFVEMTEEEMMEFLWADSLLLDQAPGNGIWTRLRDAIRDEAIAEERSRIRSAANDIVETHEHEENDCWRHGYPNKQSEDRAKRFTDGLRAGVAQVLAAVDPQREGA